MLKTLITSALALLALAAQAQHGPYAGEQQRDIKALSEQDTRTLRDGLGSGYAKAAELNGYPGPMHMLELARRLELTPEQEAATRRLLAEHKAKARDIGAHIVDAERALDTLFARAQATPDAVQAAVLRIGELQARLRAEHLNTHLAQAALLDGKQIAQYVDLRGYSSGAQQTPQTHAHH
jgi:DNA-binding MarR family transcriptional regulator